MRRTSLSVCLISLLIWSGSPASTTNLNQVAAQQQAQTSPSQTRTWPSPSEQHARTVENFKPARDLLLKKGVPFEPEVLLSTRWKELLAPKFAQMPEMQLIRRLGKRFKGVQLADILYLPEKVELTGDTVILANQVIFEGRHAVLKGNYSVYFFPVVTEGVLGTTLEAAMREQGVQFTTVSFKSSPPTLFIPPKRFAPRLLQEGWSLTIDTSGKGRKEWLEEQKQRTQGGFQKVSLQLPVDNSGGPGSTGSTGNIGPTGSNGTPDPARKGDDGVCGFDANGSTGFPGSSGGTGGTGTIGGEGGTGGDAAPITATINTATGTYIYKAKGGEGGQGGKGGPGGPGGPAAQGGMGGNGADCPCSEGGAGNGGTGGLGGQGGKGGRGQRGGPGGPGGVGKDIIVNIPDNFIGIISADPAGGRGGPGGEPGDPGFPGTSGPGGERGRGATIWKPHQEVD